MWGTDVWLPSEKLPVVSSQLSHRHTSIFGNDVWQHAGCVANQESSLEPWRPEFFSGLGYIDMEDCLHS